MSIGKKIKQARIEAGFTRKKLATDASITESGLFKIEKDEHVPRLDVAARIAKALSISLDSIS